MAIKDEEVIKALGFLSPSLLHWAIGSTEIEVLAKTKRSAYAHIFYFINIMLPQ